MNNSIKNLIQKALNTIGYRIVPAERDPKSLYQFIKSKPITTVIDVGANTGQSCAEWLKLFPLAKIHAIEPLEQFHEALNTLASANPKRMNIWPYAATNAKGEVKFFLHRDHPSSSSLLSSTSESHTELPFTQNSKEIRVNGTRLDQLFFESNVDLGKSIFMKLDIQGSELTALNGCSGFLEHVQALQCEINLMPLYDGQAKFQDILEYLRSHQLEFSGVTEQFHVKSGQAVYFDAIFMRNKDK